MDIFSQACSLVRLLAVMPGSPSALPPCFDLHALSWLACGSFTQARKRHIININFLVRLALGRPQVWDKPRFSPSSTPGTNPVEEFFPSGRRAAEESLRVKSTRAFSLAIHRKHEALTSCHPSKATDKVTLNNVHFMKVKNGIHKHADHL